MPKSITLYHGSNQIIPQPALDKGKITNDYGQGFYCTAHYPLAYEWATKDDNSHSYVNEYELDLTDLKVPDLSAPDYHIPHWITLPLEHRTFPATSPLSLQSKQYLMEHFRLDISQYDVPSCRTTSSSNAPRNTEPAGLWPIASDICAAPLRN